MPDPSDLSAHREELRRQFAAISDLGSGSPVQNYRRNDGPERFCADNQYRGHGPYWLLTRSVAGKTRSRSIPSAQVAATKGTVVLFRPMGLVCGRVNGNGCAWTRTPLRTLRWCGFCDCICRPMTGARNG